MKKWETYYRVLSTDNKNEYIKARLYLDFPTSSWNKSTERPVIEIVYHDRKVESGWWVDKLKDIWYTQKPYRDCEIRFNYFQSMPYTKIYSSYGDRRIHYDDFTLEYCQKIAEETFKQHLQNIYLQL